MSVDTLPGATQLVAEWTEPRLLRAGGARAWVRVLADYVALTKPRIVLLVVLTAGAGYWLGARASSRPLELALTLLGTALVAGGASAWNQALEHERDRLMRRTARRPVAAGRVRVLAAMGFGSLLALFGLMMLAFGGKPGGMTVALATFVLYVFVYTPLKTATTLNTAVGAVPGALPPVIGWVAATGDLGVEALALFLVVFLWQFPHFLSIAWVHRQDYARGGFRMLPGIDPAGRRTARESVVYALILIPVGLLPTSVGLAGPWYFAGALLLGLYYLYAAFRFWLDVSDRSARGLMRASFLYLPLIYLLLFLNPLPV